MKVALDCIIYGLQRLGGISTYWQGLVAHLSRARDVDLILRLPRGLQARDALPNASVPLVQRDVFPATLARYMPVSVHGSADLHHSSYYRVPISRRTRSVVTVHDFIYERFRRGLPRVLHSAQKLAAIRQAQGVICVSQNTRRDLFEHMPGIDPERIVVIPLGVDSARMFPLAPDEIDRSASDIVLFVGRRTAYKRFDLAVRAVCPIRDLRFGIVGPALTAQETELLNGVLGDRWTFFGSVSGERLRVLYGSCFAYLCTSSYEGFGLPVLEAMSCGTPAVVANLSSFPEVGGAAALYAESQTPEAYAAHLGALFSGQLRQSKIREGLAQAQLFSWEKTFERTTEFYRNVIAAHPHHRSR